MTQVRWPRPSPRFRKLLNDSMIPHASEMFGRRFADLLLFCVTSTELVILFLLTPTFTITDWIYVLQHIIVLVIALTRRRPKVWITPSLPAWRSGSLMFIPMPKS